MKRILGVLSVLVCFTASINAQQNVLISTGGSVAVATGDKFYDAGGPGGNDGNTDYTITLTPANPGETVCVDFTSFISTLSSGFAIYADRLEIFDGPTTASNQIGSLQGNYAIRYNGAGTPRSVGQDAVGGLAAELTPGMFCANNAAGVLTFRFDNDDNDQYAGWEGDIVTFLKSTLGCNVNLTATPNPICSGDPVTLLAYGDITSPSVDANFDNSTMGTGWNSTPGSASFFNSLTCQPNNGYNTASGSTFLWMQNVAAPRILESNGFDVSSGGWISFDFRQASDDNGGNGCEALDNEEGVYVQYSTNNGTTWTTFKLMHPSIEGGGLLGCGEYVYDWNTTTLPIPAAAQSANTKFRWIQPSSSSASTDSWGIDEIKVSTKAASTLTIREQATGNIIATTTVNDSLQIVVNPTTTTTYIARITNGIDSCDTPITVTVNPCGCSASVGTLNPRTTGNTTNNGAAADQFILCDNDRFLVDTVNGYTAATGANPALDYAIYTCAPTAGVHPHNDPCFSGAFIETPPSVNELNNGGINSNIITYLNGIGQTVTNNTVWIVPITLSLSAANANEYDSTCYDLGTPYEVTYLNPITTSEVTDCNAGTLTVTVSGGYPEFFTGNYNLTNTGSGTLSSATISASGGTVVINGLTAGDSYSFTILDDNNCPQTFSGTYTCFECGTCVTPNCLIAGSYANYATAASGANHCSQINNMGVNTVNGSTFTSYHQLTSSPSGSVGVVISVGVNAIVGGTPCPVTRVATLYPIGGPCTVANGIVATTTTANGSPFYNPEFTGLTPNTNYVLEIVFTVPAGCEMVDHCESYYFPPACSADVGDIAVTGNGTLVGTNEYDLTNCNTITFTASNEDLNGGALAYGWAVFSCKPTLPFTAAEILDFNNHPCYLGQSTGLTTSDTDAGGVSGGIVGGYDTLYVVPYTTEALQSGSLDNNADGCYDYGDIYQINYIAPVCGDCTTPTCPIGGVNEFADRTYLLCDDPCADLNDLTHTTYHTVTTDAFGNVGVVQQLSFDQVLCTGLTRTAVLRDAANSCAGPDILPTTANANVVGSGFNPEWIGLTPLTNYTLIITTVIGTDCNYDFACVDYYGIPGCTADVGDIAVTGNGTLVGTDEYDLTNCNTITFTASNEDLNGGALAYGWAVFSCKPTLPFTAAEILDFNNHPCYLGQSTGLTTSDTDAGGVSGGIVGGYDTLYVVPYTTEALQSGSLDNNADGCYDYGDIYQINYIAPVCGDCTTPTCPIGGVNEFADRTYLLCDDPCADLNDLTHTTYHTVTTDAFGNVGVVQQLSFDQVLCTGLTRTAVLRDAANSCAGPDILPTATNANVVGSGFNPEWIGLTPLTNYTLIITTVIGTDCNYDFACVDYYGIPGCVANSGNTNAVTTDPTNNDYVLCFNEEIDLTTTGYTLPDGAPTAGFGYALYTCAPTTNDPATDPCFSGQYVIGDVANSINDGTFAPALAAVNQTIWLVPITMDDVAAPGFNHDADNDSCFAMGTPIEITYLNAIDTVVTKDCAAGEITVQISGGYPEFFTGNYNITNNGAGTLSATTLATHNGTVTLSGLTNGMNYDLSIVDDNACTITNVTGTFVSVSVDSIVVTDELCAGQCDGTIAVYSSNATLFGISNGALGAANQFTGLCNGNYTLQVADAAGCSFDTNATVGSPQPIVVTADPTQTICIGQSVNLGASVTGGVGTITYTWDNGVGTGQTPLVSPGTTTTYNVSATDNNNCPSNVASQTITVNAPLIVAAFNDTTVCRGNSANIQALATGGDGNYTYTWDNGAGVGTSVNVTPNATTNYTVTVTDGCGSPAANDAVLVTIQELPVVSFSNTFANCDVVTATFVSDNSNDLSLYNATFVWDLGDGTTLQSKDSVVYNYTNPGCYDVTYTITDSVGCSNSSTVLNAACVHQSPTADFTFSPDEIDILNTEVDFQDLSTSTSALTYSWVFYTGSTNILSGLANPTVNFPDDDEGEYLACLSITDGNSCVDSICKTVEIDGVLFFNIPNAFTPDGDGLNEDFKPILSGVDVEDYEFFIFDRWGELLFETNNLSNGWDGTYKGENAPLGVYVWKLKFKNPITQKLMDRVGKVTKVK